jgi:hypothetical protein
MLAIFGEEGCWQVTSGFAKDFSYFRGFSVFNYWKERLFRQFRYLSFLFQ